MRTALSIAREWVWLSLLVACVLSPTSVLAQVHIPPAALVEQASLDDVLHQGELLERDRRWGDALAHYENALHNFPERRELRHRLVLARTHIDIGRRYADPSFLESLQRLNEQQALDLYSEVLLKIDTYHVNPLDWAELARQGVLHVEVALTESGFLDFLQPSTTSGNAFAQHVGRVIDLNRVQSRHQAREAAATVSQLALRELGIAPQAAILEFTCAAAQSLDQYSSYLTGDQLDEVFSQIEGNFVGLGIELKADNDTLLIVNVIPGGPAQEAGVVRQDRILEIDGRTVRELSTDAAADMLKGAELSYVDLALQSPQGTLRRLRVQRRRVDVPSVQDKKIVDRVHGVAYLKLTSFQKTTSQDFDNALWSLHRQGMRVLIVDVRGNPGGLLNAAVDVADKFLSSGTIVSTRGRSSREDYDYQAHEVGTWRVPLFVLIDGDAASASEIFAGAMRDHRRGTVVGQRSYGKGSVQGIFPLSRYKAGIRLTTAKFYSPSGQQISHRGVTPDIVVGNEPRHLVARPSDEGELLSLGADATLQAALEVARRSTQYQVRRAQ